MASVFLFVAAVVDLILFVILIGVSGFLFGTGPQSLHGGALMATVYTVGVIGCLAAPVAGLVLHRYGKTASGMLVAWLPPVGALVVTMIPAPTRRRRARRKKRSSRGPAFCSYLRVEVRPPVGSLCDQPARRSTK